MPGKLSYKRFSFGYTFEENKEVISLIFINYFIILLFSVIVLMLHVADEELLPVTYRYHCIILMSMINLVLIKYNQAKIARLNLLIALPFLIMLLPQLAGLRDNEFYFWFPYVPIGFSLVAQFTLHPMKDQYLLLTFLLSYFFLGLFIDNFMIYFSDMEEEIIPIVQRNRLYYNLIPVFLFIFVNIGIGLILRQNSLYEERLFRDGKMLEESNLKLSNQKQELLAKNNDLDQTLKQLYTARDKLVQSEKLAALGTLTAGIAHEINNPLNFISVSLQEMSAIVKEHPDLHKNESKQDLLQHYLELTAYAEEGVERVTNIVTKLGTLKSRNKQAMTKTPVDDLIQAALLKLTAKLPLDIKIVLDFPDNMIIRCDVIDIQHVVQNIISNAIDAISEKVVFQNEEISISAYEETIEQKKYVTISISNTGPLIPESDSQKLFDPFFTTKGQREGLGLSICFNIIEKHKGMINVENRDERVVFLISIPQKS